MVYALKELSRHDGGKRSQSNPLAVSASFDPSKPNKRFRYGFRKITQCLRVNNIAQAEVFRTQSAIDPYQTLQWPLKSSRRDRQCNKPRVVLSGRQLYNLFAVLIQSCPSFLNYRTSWKINARVAGSLFFPARSSGSQSQGRPGWRSTIGDIFTKVAVIVGTIIL
jgi:hypothetical protein